MNNAYCAQDVFYSLMSGAPEHQICLTQLVNSGQSLEGWVVNHSDFFRIKPNKARDRKEELLAISFLASPSQLASPRVFIAVDARFHDHSGVLFEQFVGWFENLSCRF